MDTKRKTKGGVFAAIRTAAAGHKLLSTGTILCAAASVLASLLPPLLLGRIIDMLTGGTPLVFTAALLYFGSLALEGVLSSAQKTLLEIFGQKMAHALRSELSAKLTRLPAAVLAAQDPGEVAARFSGDVDTVEALFTSGVISMAADACRILSILAVIAVKDPGLALVLLLVLPLLTVFTRHVQKRMLAAQLDNRRAVAAISGQVPEALHNIRTLRALGLEDYMTRHYDRRIGESYAAVERTNFYDVIYSPVVLVLSAAVVGTVMLLSASGDPHILKLFGMSVGTSVTIIDYISRIFTPIESLGMEIQTIQSAMAGVKRISRAMAERTARLAGLDEVIRTLPSGYDTPCADGLFSRGEWQLLSFARAAAADPAVLLLDEITANLDAETEARVLEALRRASEGRTVLSISHRIYESLGGRTIDIKPQNGWIRGKRPTASIESELSGCSVYRSDGRRA